MGLPRGHPQAAGRWGQLREAWDEGSTWCRGVQSGAPSCGTPVRCEARAGAASGSGGPWSRLRWVSCYFVMLTAQVGPHQLAASEGERCPGPAQAVLAGPALCRQRLPLPAGLPSPVC